MRRCGSGSETRSMSSEKGPNSRRIGSPIACKSRRSRSRSATARKRPSKSWWKRRSTATGTSPSRPTRTRRRTRAPRSSVSRWARIRKPFCASPFGCDSDSSTLAEQPLETRARFGVVRVELEHRAQVRLGALERPGVEVEGGELLDEAGRPGQSPTLARSQVRLELLAEARSLRRSRILPLDRPESSVALDLVIADETAVSQ